MIVFAIVYEKTAEADERIVMTYVPSHLYHILFELLKVCAIAFIVLIFVL